jgi:hypothetical protein
MMAAVFSMQVRINLRYATLIILHADIEKGFGQFTGALVMLIVTQGFKGSLEPAASYAKCSGACHLAVDKMWRVLVGKFLASGRI